MYVLVFIIGAVMGSFANVCIYRIPRGQSVVYPSSHCVVCNRRINTFDLIPIISYLVLHGRCRYCGKQIVLRYFLVEMTMAIGFSVLWLLTGDIIRFAVYAIHFFILFAASVIDLEHLILPRGY
jgi:leader peptidase (prepilin peptidase)/N-methyltransferase